MKQNMHAETPPLFKKWRTWYVIVVLNLCLWIGLFFWFTRFFH